MNTYLKSLRSSELLIRKQLLGFRPGFDLMSLGADNVPAEDVDEILVAPLLDVVVGGVHAVDEALFCVAFVADEEAVGRYRSDL